MNCEADRCLQGLRHCYRPVCQRGRPYPVLLWVVMITAIAVALADVLFWRT